MQNTGIDAVQEFQVAQSTLNPAQSVASGGAVNILTKSGINAPAWYRIRVLSAIRDSVRASGPVQLAV